MPKNSMRFEWEISFTRDWVEVTRVTTRSIYTRKWESLDWNSIDGDVTIKHKNWFAALKYHFFTEINSG